MVSESVEYYLSWLFLGGKKISGKFKFGLSTGGVGMNQVGMVYCNCLNHFLDWSLSLHHKFD